MENEEKTVSLGEIFKVIFGKAWLLVGITVIFTLVFSLLVEFVYNREFQYYSVSYTLYYPGISSGNYPDGTTFRVANLVSLDTLNAVKSGAEGRFDSVDLQKMKEEDDITVRETTELNLSSAFTDYTSAFTERRFTITMSGKYFRDSEQAVDFIRAVAKYPVDYVNAIAQSDYTSNLKAYEEAETYESKISFLSAQSEYLQSLYTGLIATSSGDYKVNNKSLNTYLMEVSNIFSADTAKALLDEAAAEHFVVDAESYLKTLSSRESVLKKSQEANQSKIDALVAEMHAIYGDDLTGMNTDGFNVQIAALELENAAIRQELESIAATRSLIESNSEDPEHIEWQKSKEAFDATLADYRKLLDDATLKCKGVRIAVFGEKSYVEFDFNRIEPQGGIHIVVAVIVGLILGFILASVVICIRYLPKYLKSRGQTEDAQSPDPEKQE